MTITTETAATIDSTKGTHSGTIAECLAWQDEMQGAYATLRVVVDGDEITADVTDDTDAFGAILQLLADLSEVAEGDEAAFIATVTDEQIEALRAESAEAGDAEQVAICARALNGDNAARAECIRVIEDAAAQDDA